MTPPAPRYQVGYTVTGMGRFGWVLDSRTDDLKVAGQRVLGLRSVGYDAHVHDAITGMPVPEEAYNR